MQRAKVSIHAPTWGATGGQLAAIVGLGFQSTRPRGARHTGSKASRAHRAFQSTRPRGARHVVRCRCQLGQDVSIHAPTWGATCAKHGAYVLRCFNPRAHVGRDADERRPTALHHVSIHAPTWGATWRNGNLRVYPSVSIHAPTWGATLCSYNNVILKFCFNPRAHVGRD